MEILINHISELDRAVEQLFDFVKDRKKFFLTGELGAGKTAFVQAFCRYLKVEEQVTSPTYSIVNEYTFDQGKKLVHHIDLYRLKNLEEALQIGIEDYLNDANYCLIEWPDLIEEIAPSDVTKINIIILDESRRKILFL